MSRRYASHQPTPALDADGLAEQMYGTRHRHETVTLPGCRASCCAPGQPTTPVAELAEPRWLLAASLLLIALTVARCAGH